MNGLNFRVEDKATLHKMYMPFIVKGAIFIPTNQTYDLGDNVSLSLSFAFSSEQLSFKGKVIWITPDNAHGGKVQGIGVQFPDLESDAIRSVIEKLLGPLLSADSVTYTL